MKRMALLSLVLLAQAVFGCDSEKATPSATAPAKVEKTEKAAGTDKPSKEAKPGGKYSVASAIIHYEVTGPRMGTEELYVVDYGAKEARYSKVKIAAAKKVPAVEQLILLEGNKQSVVDLKTNRGTSLMMAAAPAGGQSMWEAAGGKKAGTRTIAGIECELWTIAATHTEVCIKHGIPLETTMKMGGTTLSTKATKVQFGAEVPPDKVSLPKGAKLTETKPMPGAAKK